MSAGKGQIITMIREGRTALGIEFGSTRIKAVLIGEDHSPIAMGSHDWEKSPGNWRRRRHVPGGHPYKGLRRGEAQTV